jgi:hypothetical protein
MKAPAATKQLVGRTRPADDTRIAHRVQEQLLRDEVALRCALVELAVDGARGHQNLPTSRLAM